MLLFTLSLLVLGVSAVTSTDISIELLRNEPHKYVSTLYKIDDAEKKEDTTKKIEIVCGSEGCNKTETKTKETAVGSSNEITSDIVVQIKTGADKDTKKNQTTEEETPDVPVVLGLDGVTNNQYPNTDVFNPNPLLISNLGPVLPVNPHVRNGNNGFIPISPPQFDKQFGSLDRDHVRYHNNGFMDRRTDIFHPPIWQNGNMKRRTYWWYPNSERRTDFVKPTLPSWPTVCTCNPNQPNSWQHMPQYVPLNQPGNQINDKLMPLN